MCDCVGCIAHAACEASILFFGSTQGSSSGSRACGLEGLRQARGTAKLYIIMKSYSRIKNITEWEVVKQPERSGQACFKFSKKDTKKERTRSDDRGPRTGGARLERVGARKTVECRRETSSRCYSVTQEFTKFLSARSWRPFTTIRARSVRFSPQSDGDDVLRTVGDGC